MSKIVALETLNKIVGIPLFYKLTYVVYRLLELTRSTLYTYYKLTNWTNCIIPMYFLCTIFEKVCQLSDLFVQFPEFKTIFLPAHQPRT